MKRNILFILFCICLVNLYAADVYAPWRQSWLEKAYATTPELVKSLVKPLRLVKPCRDESAFQGWRMDPSGDVSDLYANPINEQNGVVIDFGEHITGCCSFTLKPSKHVPDAPVRLKFTFAEVPGELMASYDPYTGGLSRAWLQDEVVTVNTIPCTITIPRRVAFRYVKIELMGNFYDFYLTDINCETTTSVSRPIPQLPEYIDDKIKRIYNVGINTLKECMQTVYEDGPKRDRRLWIGDLYLEALANMYSFENYDITKHCLYVLAALAREDGLLHATVFERPELHPQTGTHIVDYSLLYNVALFDYLRATDDKETVRDLWPVVKEQIKFACKYLESDYIYNPSKEQEMWIFFDWTEELDRRVPIQGAMIYSLNNSAEMARILGYDKLAQEWEQLAKNMGKAVRKANYDSKRGIFVSGPDKQVSYISQIWMILAGVMTQEEGTEALNYVFADEDALYPGTPYAYHYLIEAMIKCGMYREAKERLLAYWGGMVDKGADTFWEVYDPNDDFRSPYNFYPVNSYCHAWSCTPVYFINKYPEIFLGL